MLSVLFLLKIKGTFGKKKPTQKSWKELFSLYMDRHNILKDLRDLHRGSYTLFGGLSALQKGSEAQGAPLSMAPPWKILEGSRSRLNNPCYLLLN